MSPSDAGGRAQDDDDEELPPLTGLSACGYCGSPIEVDGEILHLPTCNAPKDDPDGTEIF